MLIAKRLFIPENSHALLWDMDGVLLDTLGLDLLICNQLLQRYTGKNFNLPAEFIKSIFAYHPHDFWIRIFKYVKNKFQTVQIDQFFDPILRDYNQERIKMIYHLNPGVLEIIKEIKDNPGINLKMAVVSNNNLADLTEILSKAQIIDYFDLIVGNDIKGLQVKPAPDTYIYAADKLGVNLKDCVVVEDSLQGVQAGFQAGAFTIGVATGGATYYNLENSPWTLQVYTSFQPLQINLSFGNVTQKQIITPNDFVSHTLEHIAWRLGCSIDLFWNSNTWFELGEAMGHHIGKFNPSATSAASMGMIDDGSAEIFLQLDHQPDLRIHSPDWFLKLRCEQLKSGQPLVDLLKGLSQGLKAYISIRICSIHDPHHTWEAVFRGLGTALGHIYKSAEIKVAPLGLRPDYGIRVLELGPDNVHIIRTTAESKIDLCLRFEEASSTQCYFKTKPCVNVNEFTKLLELTAQKAGYSLVIDFEATQLSSSHVVMEDTGLVLGLALKKILLLRMDAYGINGAGSSLSSQEDFDACSIRVAVSVEGRKFFKIISLKESYSALQKNFILNQNILGTLFSEDLDDFLDGLAGGLGTGIIVHLVEKIEPDQGWQMLFSELGRALKEVFAANPHRRGVPPGVKATLA